MQLSVFGPKDSDLDSDSVPDSNFNVDLQFHSSNQKLASFCDALPQLLSQQGCLCFCKCLRREHHVCKLNFEGPVKFCEMHCMHHRSFVELCPPADPLAGRNAKTTNTQSGPVTTQIASHFCVCWLSGGNCNQICLLAGISVGLSTPSTQLVPWDLTRWWEDSDQSAPVTTSGGCVASVGRLLTKTRAPKNKKAGDVKALFSRCRRARGSKCQFAHVVTESPVGASGCNAHGRSNLANQVDELPKRRHVVGNDARVVTEHLLTPSNAVRAGDCQPKQCCSQHLSQRRVRIEMAVGCMVGKQRTLQAPFNCTSLVPCKFWRTLQGSTTLAPTEATAFHQRQVMTLKSHSLLSAANSMMRH